jgi:hypothetical protein
MTAREHNKILGILFLVQGVLGALGILMAIMMFGFAGMAIAASSGSSEGAIGGLFVFGLLIGILLIASIFLIPPFAAGYGLLKEKGWGRIWAIIAACLSLLSFPLGTAIGIYALWFLFGDQGKQFYATGGYQSTGTTPPPPQSWQ